MMDTFIHAWRRRMASKTPNLIASRKEPKWIKHKIASQFQFLTKSWIYQKTLLQHPLSFNLLDWSDNWPGNAEHGQSLIQEVADLFDEQDNYNLAPLWNNEEADLFWLQELHGFIWLRDLRAVGGATAKQMARLLVKSWITLNSHVNFPAWNLDVTANRLALWLGHINFIIPENDDDFLEEFTLSVTRQTQHLARVLPGTLIGSDLLYALKGFIVASLFLNYSPWLDKAINFLKTEIHKQFYENGAHIECCPSQYLTLLKHFIDLRSIFASLGSAVPECIQDVIDGLVPSLKKVTHGDGKLALFNSSYEEEDWNIDIILNQASPRNKNKYQAHQIASPQGEFHKLSAGRTIVIADCNNIPPRGYDRYIHASCLSFEMSVGRERLIVNCGSYPGQSEWAKFQKNTASHSTLVVHNTNCMMFLPDKTIGRGPTSVTSKRHEIDGNIWLEASHDGYAYFFGILHKRRWHLTNEGDMLEGEDHIIGPGGYQIMIPFHLHPHVHTSLSHNSQTALLRLPSGSGWRLRTSIGEMTLEESIYFGQYMVMEKSQQLVINHLPMTPEVIVQWSLTRETRSR
ncbi:MAG: heparinase II/III family protein [Alphaproteobacteria bacterium]|nr:heparinase II/III family protein [Alphaproteobacteria bacterium]